MFWIFLNGYLCDYVLYVVVKYGLDWKYFFVESFGWKLNFNLICWDCDWSVEIVCSEDWFMSVLEIFLFFFFK